jgi:hypothetical protein
MPIRELEVSSQGLWQDSRMAECGFFGGLTKRSMGNLKDLQVRKRVFSEIPGLSGKIPRVLSQVHGTKIFEAEKGGEKILEGDGWVCRQEGIIPIVLVADCVPLFIWSRKNPVFGVFHAGWRGMAKSFAYIAATEIQRVFNVKAGELLASAGPHIGSCCCEVGPEIKEFFPSEDFIEDKKGLRLDLNLEAKNQLLRAGLSENSIYLSSECTVCSPGYFSNRQGDSERMAAFITLKEGPLCPK